MNNKEREAIEKYVLKVFHYEHQCSTEILARMMLLCEKKKKKGVLTDEEVMEKLSMVNIAEIMNELNYGDDTWKEEKIHNESN